ncbi:MAG: NAD(P)/FAD-dependent oxidoreductase [Bauldia sp.]
MAGPTANTSDVIVIGGGHNGLTCAAYLAATGLKVTVLERRGVVGGAAVTEEFHPGFRNSLASYTVSLLNRRVIVDLDLARHGLRIVERRLHNFLPLPDGRHLKIGTGVTEREVARFSAKDSARLPDYWRRLEAAADVLRQLALDVPPKLVGGTLLDTFRDVVQGTRFARRARSLDIEGRRVLFDLIAKSAGDFLDGWFESAPIKAIYGFDGIVGSYTSPYATGSAYVLLHHAFGEVNGRRGQWGHAIGGMGAITEAMARSCGERQVRIVMNAEVREVLTARGRANGVVTADGERYQASVVVSNLNPRLLFRDLLDPAVLPREFLDRMATWRSGSGTFRMNVALSELPDFTALPGKNVDDHHTSGIVIAPSLGYLDRAYLDARSSGWSKAPVIELLIPSTLDDSLAPSGRHVASLFCQHVAPDLPDGKRWDDYRDAVADLMIDTVTAYAPNFRSAIIARQALSPLDLERTLGMVGGDIFHGAMTLDQIFAARPMLGYADHRTPLAGLYQCGAGTHPGGGVTGLPGRNAAREILKDLRRRRRVAFTPG